LENEEEKCMDLLTMKIWPMILGIVPAAYLFFGTWIRKKGKLHVRYVTVWSDKMLTKLALPESIAFFTMAPQVH